MKQDIITKKDARFLYLGVYEHFKAQILGHELPMGTRMPSLRKCADELGLSRTTVENAYLQLAADGYILSRAQSGYYVTDIAARTLMPEVPLPDEPPVLFDFSSGGADPEVFRMQVWRRYLKSALRQENRMQTYGDPQGEPDLREALCEYVRQRRNLLCSPEEIVVSAGTQSLLQLLCPLLTDCRTVSFPTREFLQGSTVFSDYGFEVHYRDKDCQIIYVSPAHMTKWGDVMPVKRRTELLALAKKEEKLIIEDDYGNEFVYSPHPTPSLFGLDTAQRTVYLGSFSRLLLPSIRIGFMILPPMLNELYHKRASLYNQTASKAEQIALAQYLRDGHLQSHIRRQKRLYHGKMVSLREAVRKEFRDTGTIRCGDAGVCLALTLPCPAPQALVEEKLKAAGILVSFLSSGEGEITLLLNCSAVPAGELAAGIRRLSAVMHSPGLSAGTKGH